jgi:hypothetical protein
MRIIILSNEFPPIQSSGAIQVCDLAKGFADNGHQVVILTGIYGVNYPYSIEIIDGFKVIRLPAFKSKDISYSRRTISEIFTPYKMLYIIKKYKLLDNDIEGLIWYSPTIFLGVIAKYITNKYKCRNYLIVRDLFPDWAVDTGILKKGIIYKLLKIFENYQYRVAHTIGVQSKGNLKYFSSWESKKRNIEVLHNWLSHKGNNKSSINLENSKLSGRKVFVYAGNMGIAQGVEIFFNLAKALSYKDDIGFLFVGRGKIMKEFSRNSEFLNLKNLLMFDFIPPTEIPDLYRQCYAGIIALDIRHKTHNIPGKFLSYMASGLPVLASVNPDNDLIDLINDFKVGKVISNSDIDALKFALDELQVEKDKDPNMYIRNCKNISEKLFNTNIAVKQIFKAF